MEHRDPALREQLVIQFMPLVPYVLARTPVAPTSTLDYNDLVSAGTVGLIEAVDRFDPEHGAKFETYAILRVRGAIIDTIRVDDWLPRNERIRIRSGQTTAPVVLSMDRATSEKPWLGLTDPNADDITFGIEQAEAADELLRLVQQLPERQRRLLTLYYWGEKTLREVGEMFGVSESLVCKLHKRVLGQLRVVLAKAV